MITSALTPQSQPAAPTYAMQELTLLQTYTRAQVEAANGPQPPFDKSRPEQDWWIDGVEPGLYSYTGILNPGTGAQSLAPYSTPNAGAPNFKGIPAYPAWTPLSTVAVQPHAAPSAPSPVDPNTLSTAEQSAAMLTLLGGSSVVDTGAEQLTLPGIGEIEFPITYGTEGRRAYAVVLSNGKQFNVGLAQCQMWGTLAGFKGARSLGIGAPGQFVPDTSNTSGLSWQPNALDDGSEIATPALPVPCRALLANEKIITVNTGSILGSLMTEIERTDMQQTPAAGSLAAGVDTPLAIQTNQMVAKILAYFPGA